VAGGLHASRPSILLHVPPSVCQSLFLSLHLPVMSDSRSLTLVGDFLEEQARSNPELKEQYTELNAAVQKK
jgi:hypothetical protein